MKKLLLSLSLFQIFAAIAASALDFAPTTEEEQTRLKGMMIEKFWSEGMPLDRALYTLSELTWNSTPQKPGLKISTAFKKEDYNPKIFIPLKENLTVEQHLNRIMKASGCLYHFEGLEVIVTLKPKESGKPH